MSEEQIWQVKKLDNKKIEAIAEKLKVSTVMATILVNRKFESTEEVKAFLYQNPRDLRDPCEIPALKKAAERIYLAIQKGENILVYGDYDVDGVTATVLLMELLSGLGGKVNYYIPNRIEEGYGLNIQAIEKAKKEGTNLIITVDCGIASLEEVAYAVELGIDIVITDHHEPQANLPNAVAVVDPKIAVINKESDKNLPWLGLAGVGVAFKVGQAVARLMNKEESCYDYLDLVALGTIADIVPMRGENRILVKEGLKHINSSTCRVGLKSLIECAGLKLENISVGNVGFVIAPRLNACGRLGKADMAVKLLLSNNVDQALEISTELEDENKTRRDIEGQIYKEAMEQLENEGGIKDKGIIVLFSKNWHTGVLGIVASRITEKYYRPSILINIENGIGKGSGRSIHGFNLYKALEKVKDNLLRFGGHEMAAGLTLKEDEIVYVRDTLQEYAKTVLDKKILTPVLNIDAEVSMEDINEGLINEIELLSPFGNENPTPVLVVRASKLEGVRGVGQTSSHLKLKVVGDNRCIDGIGYRMGNLLDEILEFKSCDVAFIPEMNNYKGNSCVQMKVESIKSHYEPDDPLAPLSFTDELFRDGEIWLEDDCYRDIINREQFYTKVVGVTFENRQEVIKNINTGEALALRREPNNPFDNRAIGVYYKNSSIGYLKVSLANNLFSIMDKGTRYQAYVTQVTGQNRDTLGVNICVQRIDDWEKQESDLEIKERLEHCSCEEIQEKTRKVILGNSNYHEKQKEAIGFLKEGHNTLIVFGTGRGKTAVFQAMAAILALNEKKITLLVYPLRSLVNDQYHRLQGKMSLLGVRISAINGSVSIPERREFFKNYYQGKVDMVLTTPEFLAFHIEEFQTMAEKIGLFVVDEAHHLAKSKRRGYKLLGRCWQQLGKPLSLAATATADDDVAQSIIKNLCSTRLVVEKHVRDNLILVDSRGEKDKLQYLLKLLDSGERIVIYVNSRKQAYQLASDLRFYYPAGKNEIAFYHGGLNSDYRVLLENMYRDGTLRVMVTTSAFGEGIDIPDIKHVVLYHLCFSFTEFNQLSGRAGRNNEEAKIHLLFNEKDKKINELILEGVAPNREILGKIYLFLREQASKCTPIQITNREIMEAMLKKGANNFKEQTAAACLGILEEIGLLLREVEGSKRYIHLVPPPPGKLDLTDSIRYLEGYDELEDFKSFASYALNEGKDSIIAGINTPIYPAKPVL